MNMQRAGIVIVASTAALGGAGTASAEIIEFTFGGTLTLAEGSSIIEPELGDLQVGDAVTVRYTFDSEAEDQDDASSTRGLYAMLSYQITVSDVTLDIGLQDADISISAGNFDHTYFASAENFFDPDGGRGVFLQQLSVALLDPSATAFDDDSLPLDLSLDDFATTEFSYREIDEFLGARGTPFEFDATLETFSRRVVPAPGAAAVLLGFAGITRRRRR